MGVANLGDPWEALRDLARRVKRLESGTFLENSSITDGRLRIIRGQILIENGNLTVDGEVPIVLHQEGGAARIDFGAAAYMLSLNGAVVITSEGGTGMAIVGPDSAALQGGAGHIEVNDEDVIISGLPTQDAMYTLGITSDNRVVRMTGGTGGSGGTPDPGPGDGTFRWPFSLDLVTSEFRTAERPNHDGMDFGKGIANVQGTPIASMGAGVVHDILSVNDGTHGWGNGVIVNHGSDPLYGNANVKTLYAHMYTTPAVTTGQSVTIGQTLGGIGNTGNSFGNHLHLEVWVNDSPVNPRTFMAAHGG